MPSKRQRHVRAHALKPGDELWLDFRWWIVKNVRHTNETIWLLAGRGSVEKDFDMGRNKVVRIMRPA